MPFDYLHNYETFSSVAAMDEAVATQLAQHTLTKSERAILLRIAQSALQYPGAAHLKAATIAKSVDVSTKTVYRAVKKLQALGILRIIAGTKLNGIKGANIYQILHVPSEMSERVITDKSHNDADELALSEKQTISFNLLKTSTIKEVYKDIRYMNDHQQQLYDLFTSIPMNDELKDALYAAILSTPITSRHEFITAKDTLMRLLLDIQNGTLTIRSTVRAVFKGAYDKAISRSIPKKQPIHVQAPQRPVPFYDWLTIRA